MSVQYDNRNVLKFIYLLERPTVPLYLGPRGYGQKQYLYNLPNDVLNPFEMQAMVELRRLIPSTKTIIEIPVYKTKVPYDLKYVERAVPKTVIFSEMNRNHLKASFELTAIMISQPNQNDFFNACALTRDSVNPHLWINAFYRAVLRRKEMRGVSLPAIWEVMPDLFVEATVWRKAVDEATLPENNRRIIVIDKNFSGSNLDPNHKVAYFMEDIGINTHHWHWHLINPPLAPKGSVDRRGELFYYMHHGMLARFEAERLGNGINRTVPFDIHNGFIKEACFSKLTLQTSTLNFSNRQENSILKDFEELRDSRRRFTGFGSIQTIRSWFDRIIAAIDAGFAIQNGGGRINLRTEQGIDIVAAMWESSNDSPNMDYYGIAHNYGHSAIGRSHDHDSRYQTPPGVMYLAGTSMRDPIFYRWHKYLDLLSQRQKHYLQPYSSENLQWNGIVINDVQMIRVESSRVAPSLDRVNNMVTHWMQSDIELSRGLDFGRTNINGLGSVWVRATHLQHVPFVYKIGVTNQTGAEVQATVRIFMAPKLDENGDKMAFYEQRTLFFEMDKFTTTLHPGENMITQKSQDSTLTIPWSQTFRELERNTETLTRNQAICGCGWPEHMLLPRGKLEGMPFDLFVMLTNSHLDQVPGSKRQLGTLTAKGTCRDSISLCGLIDDKIPDGRPMGYPFDRPAIPNERSKPDMFLSNFAQQVSNMATTEVNIFHIDKTILRGDGAPIGMFEMKVAP